MSFVPLLDKVQASPDNILRLVVTFTGEPTELLPEQRTSLYAYPQRTVEVLILCLLQLPHKRQEYIALTEHLGLTSAVIADLVAAIQASSSLTCWYLMRRILLLLCGLGQKDNVKRALTQALGNISSQRHMRVRFLMSLLDGGTMVPTAEYLLPYRPLPDGTLYGAFTAFEEGPDAPTIPPCAQGGTTPLFSLPPDAPTALYPSPLDLCVLQGDLMRCHTDHRSYLSDILWSWRTASREEQVAHILDDPRLAKSLPMTMAAILEEYLALPRSEFPSALYRSIMVHLCRQRDGEGGDLVTYITVTALRQLFERAASLDAEILARVRYLIVDLITSFAFQWPWQEWHLLAKSAADKRVATRRSLFLFEVLSDLTVHSYRERVERALPPELNPYLEGPEEPADFSTLPPLDERLTSAISSLNPGQVAAVSTDPLRILHHILASSVVSLSYQKQQLVALRSLLGLKGEETARQLLKHAGLSFWDNGAVKRQQTLRNMIDTQIVRAVDIAKWMLEGDVCDWWERSFPWDIARYAADSLPQDHNSISIHERKAFFRTLLEGVCSEITRRCDVERAEVSAFLEGGGGLRVQPKGEWSGKNFVWLHSTVGNLMSFLRTYEGVLQSVAQEISDLTMRAGVVDDFLSRIWASTGLGGAKYVCAKKGTHAKYLAVKKKKEAR